MKMVSNREYEVRRILKTIDETEPNLTHQYIMQLTQYVCTSGGAKNVKRDDFLLVPAGANDDEREESKKIHKEHLNAMAEAQWRSRLGPNAQFTYTPPPNVEE